MVSVIVSLCHCQSRPMYLFTYFKIYFIKMIYLSVKIITVHKGINFGVLSVYYCIIDMHNTFLYVCHFMRKYQKYLLNHFMLYIDCKT